MNAVVVAAVLPSVILDVLPIAGLVLLAASFFVKRRSCRKKELELLEAIRSLKETEQDITIKTKKGR